MRQKKQAFFKSLRYLFLASTLVFGLITMIASGGGGGGDDNGGTTPNSAPSISDLSYYPTSTIVGAGGGAIEAHFYVGFADPDGNIETLTLVELDSQDNVIDTLNIDVTEKQGVASGELEIGVVLDTTDPNEVGNYLFQVYLTDEGGLKSNTLEGDFSITLGTAPVISNGLYAPTSGFVGVANHVEGTYDFIDPDGNASYTFISIFDSTATLADWARCDPITNLDGLTAGNVSYSFDIDLPSGVYTIAVAMFDKNKLFSNTLWGSFTINNP